MGLPVPRTINDLRGDVKDGLLFVSFSIPTKNRDGTDVTGLEGFRIMKSCGACGGAFDLWKDIRLADRQGYTIRDNRLYTYDNDLRAGVAYGYRVYPYTTKGIQMDGSNVFSLTWLKPPAKPTGVTADEEDSKIVLSWERTDELSYNVYRWENGTYPLFPRNPAPLAASQFTDEGLAEREDVQIRGAGGEDGGDDAVRRGRRHNFGDAQGNDAPRAPGDAEAGEEGRRRVPLVGAERGKRPGGIQRVQARRGKAGEDQHEPRP